MQCLAQSGNISMPENAETPSEEPVTLTIPFDVLVLQELDRGLRHRNAPSHL